MTDLDPRTIAADIMCDNARETTVSEIWAHIGQAYDVTDVDTSLADEVASLISEAGIDLIWPDGAKNTELDAARVEIKRLRAELEQAIEQRDAHKAMADELRAEAAPAGELDLHTWCARTAAAHQDYEDHEIVLYEDRDTGVVGWTVRVLGNPELAESREVVRILAERHGLISPEHTPS